MQSIVEAADELGVGEDQVALLEQAITQGEVTFEIYDEAYFNFMNCLREGGIEPRNDAVVVEGGVPRHSVEYWVPPAVGPELGDRIALACENEHFMYIGVIYDTQPVTMDAWADEVAPFRPAILECLRANGAAIGDDSTVVDLFNSVDEVLANSGVNCAERAGYAYP